ncbi:hypothetical protein [Pedobacter sp.]|uniref:hypothetical protein n=1 Tax=Pedobacter sp. TaxID=1411316 RepID=UPI003D7FA66E
METLTKLSARSLQYYIITRRWSTDLDFFRIEIKFFIELISTVLTKQYDSTLQMDFSDSMIKLQEMEPELAKSEFSVAEHLEKLELIADNKIPEIQETLAAEQACLEYLMLDLAHEIRKLKTKVFNTIQIAHKFGQSNLG